MFLESNIIIVVAFILRFSLLSQNFVFALTTVKRYETSSCAVLSLNIMIYDTITKTTFKLLCIF